MTGLMSPGRMIELAIAVVLLGLSVWIYRSQRNSNEGYGSQGGVLLLVIAVIMAIHALGGLDYHPTKAEADYFKARMHAR
jgi:hypothetical protein